MSSTSRRRPLPHLRQVDRRLNLGPMAGPPLLPEASRRTSGPDPVGVGLPSSEARTPRHVAFGCVGSTSSLGLTPPVTSGRTKRRPPAQLDTLGARMTPPRPRREGALSRSLVLSHRKSPLCSVSTTGALDGNVAQTSRSSCSLWATSRSISATSSWVSAVPAPFSAPFEVVWRRISPCAARGASSSWRVWRRTPRTRDPAVLQSARPWRTDASRGRDAAPR